MHDFSAKYTENDTILIARPIQLECARHDISIACNRVLKPSSMSWIPSVSSPYANLYVSAPMSGMYVAYMSQFLSGGHSHIGGSHWHHPGQS